MSETDTISETKMLLHIGLTVKDLAASIRFYRDLVGMEITSEFTGHNDWFDKLTNNPGAELKVAHLRLGNYELQLIEYLEGGQEPPAQLGHNRVGSPHMCFVVTNVEQKYSAATERDDVVITSEITNIMAGARSFYTEDPDGVPVEFVQVPAKRRRTT